MQKTTDTTLELELLAAQILLNKGFDHNTTQQCFFMMDLDANAVHPLSNSGTFLAVRARTHENTTTHIKLTKEEYVKLKLLWVPDPQWGSKIGVDLNVDNIKTICKYRRPVNDSTTTD